MSEEQLKAFLEKVKGDTSLQEKLKAAADSNAVLAITKEAGFMISASDFKNARSELSEEELEGVAGGTIPPIVNWIGEKMDKGCAGTLFAASYTNCVAMGTANKECG